MLIKNLWIVVNIQKAAEAVCEAHMNEEIAHRFFKIINMSNDLCELFGVKRDDRE